MTMVLCLFAAICGTATAWTCNYTPRSRRLGRQRLAAISDDSSSTLQGCFEKGLMLQRAGDSDGALEQYETFVDVAKQFSAPPLTFAEVKVNMGSIKAKKKQHAAAKALFEEAIQARELGIAHVNLALVILSEASERIGATGEMPSSAVADAASHCRRALELQDDDRSCAIATRVLEDLEKKMRKRI